MAIRLKLHEDDEAELARIRVQLLQRRLQAGMTYRQLAVKAGRSDKWVKQMEQGLCHPHISSLQVWAAVFDLRVEACFWDLPEWGPDDDLPIDCLLTWQFAHKMSRPFDAYYWCRALLMADLVAYRQAALVSGADLGRRLGLSVSAISAWERDGNDPLVSKVFTYVRALGGSVTFRLIPREDWAHG